MGPIVAIFFIYLINYSLFTIHYSIIQMIIIRFVSHISNTGLTKH